MLTGPEEDAGAEDEEEGSGDDAAAVDETAIGA